MGGDVALSGSESGLPLIMAAISSRGGLEQSAVTMNRTRDEQRLLRWRRPLTLCLNCLDVRWLAVSLKGAGFRPTLAESAPWISRRKRRKAQVGRRPIAECLSLKFSALDAGVASSRRVLYAYDRRIDTMAYDDQITKRLAAIHRRLDRIAKEEAQPNLLGGEASRRVYETQRDLLIAETEDLLDRWERLRDAHRT